MSGWRAMPRVDQAAAQNSPVILSALARSRPRVFNLTGLCGLRLVRDAMTAVVAAR